MTTAAPILYAPASLKIDSPESGAEWANARALVSELFTWLEGETGQPMSALQPRASRELDALSILYVPPEGRFLVARIDGEIVGTAAIHRLSQEIFELKRVYVRPTIRGLKLGSKLVDTAIQEARKLGARSLVLESHPDVMPEAAAMYRRRGFKEVSPFSDLHTRVPGTLTMGLTLHILRNR